MSKRLDTLYAFTMVSLATLSLSCQSAESPTALGAASPASTAPDDRSVSADASSTAVPESNPQSDKAETAAAQSGPRAIRTPATDLTVLARVGDQQILGGEFRDRWLSKLRPESYDEVSVFEPIDGNDVLFDMVGEIVLAYEGRQRGLVEKDYRVADPTERFRTQQLVQAAFRAYVAPTVKASEEEIKAAMAANEKLSSEQAALTVRNKKSQAAFGEYVQKLYGTLKVKKHPENFAKAAQVHQRLLGNPLEPRKQSWIMNRQIREELPDAEKAIPLVSYEGGAFTLGDFFKALGGIAPPGRPKNLSTVAGIETFTDRALRLPLAAAAAKAGGLDKDPSVVSAIRKYEDRLLSGRMVSSIGEAVPEPTEDEITAYYETIKDHYQRRDVLTGELVWCRNRVEAAEAAQKLTQGVDVNEVRSAYSFDDKQTQSMQFYPGSEGLFWEELWAAEPNEVAGPLLGFYSGGSGSGPSLKWRVVKVLSREEGEPGELEEQGRSSLKWRIKAERRDAAVAQEVKRVLKELPHEISYASVSAFDPRRVP